MQFADPLNVDCPACGTHQPQGVAELLAFKARCIKCDASLADIGREMHEGMAQVGKQWQYAVIPLAYIQELTGVPFPDAGPWVDCTTKAELVDAFVSYLREVAPEKAVREEISAAYDRALIEEGIALPNSGTSPLW